MGIGIRRDGKAPGIPWNNEMVPVQVQERKIKKRTEVRWLGHSFFKTVFVGNPEIKRNRNQIAVGDL